MSTLLYLLMWQIEAPLWGWAIASVVIGLGFTFFSGATEAWLVDALDATGYTGPLESVFARGQVVAGVAVLVGSVGGGFIAQVTNLGVPYLLRAALLGVTVLVALWRMHDLGFSPERRGGPVEEVRRMVHATVEVGWRAATDQDGDAGRPVHDGGRHLRVLRHAAPPARAVRRRDGVRGRRAGGGGGRRLPGGRRAAGALRAPAVQDVAPVC